MGQVARTQSTWLQTCLLHWMTLNFYTLKRKEQCQLNYFNPRKEIEMLPLVSSGAIVGYSDDGVSCCLWVLGEIQYRTVQKNKMSDLI